MHYQFVFCELLTFSQYFLAYETHCYKGFHYVDFHYFIFLYSHETEFLDGMMKSGHRRLVKSFHLCCRYTDVLIVFNNDRYGDYVKEVYLSQLTFEKGNKSDDLADYLDLAFIKDDNNVLSTKLYDKCDDFHFRIASFPFLSSNIPSCPSHGVYF